MQNRNVIMRIVAVGLLLYALVSLVSVYGKLQEAEREARLRGDALVLLYEERAALERRLQPSVQEREMRRLAWERLGMVLPGEKVFCFVRDEETAG